MAFERLNRYDIYKEITSLLDANPTMDADANEIIEVYERLLNEPNIKAYNKSQHISVIHDIFYGLNRGETKEEIFRAQGSTTKHLNYFDNFLGYGESDKVTEILSLYNLPTDILKGVKPYKPQSFKSPINKDVEIDQLWTDGNDGSSPVPVYFDIYYQGKLIYHWDRNPINDYSVKEYTFDDYIDMAYNNAIASNNYRAQQTLFKEEVKTATETYTVEGYKTKKGEARMRRRYAKGTIINGVNVGGRFF